MESFPTVVQFAKLPTVFDKLNDGDDVFISGWGKTEYGIGSDVLLGATVQIQNFEDCFKASKDKYTITDRMICAGRIGGKVDSCSGNINTRGKQSDGKKIDSKISKLEIESNFLLSRVDSCQCPSCCFPPQLNI